MDLTHFNEQGRARMVDVSDKEITTRIAVARTTVTMASETLSRIKAGTIGKGDVLAVAQIAGIMAAKKTSDWIPMCHPLPLTGVNITFADNGADALYIEGTVKTIGKTGVEMEALVAASTAALTLYDMAKAIDRGMTITELCLLEKSGGKSGDFVR